jgi:hypothetical protein
MEPPPFRTIGPDARRTDQPRIVEHEYTANWGPILGGLRSSLVISTYQAGEVVVLSRGASADGLGLDLCVMCHNFEHAMGVASVTSAFDRVPEESGVSE